MCISQQFINYIINRNLVNKINAISFSHIPKLKSVNFSFVLPVDFDFENLNFLKSLLFLEYLAGQRCSLLQIGRRLDGRIVRFITYGIITLRRKNLFGFLSNLHLFMENSGAKVQNKSKIIFDSKNTKVKIVLDALIASPHIPMVLRFLNFKFFIEFEFSGIYSYESIKLLLSGLKISI
jgi:hypothetical protein